MHLLRRRVVAGDNIDTDDEDLSEDKKAKDDSSASRTATESDAKITDITVRPLSPNKSLSELSKE